MHTEMENGKEKMHQIGQTQDANMPQGTQRAKSEASVVSDGAITVDWQALHDKGDSESESAASIVKSMQGA